MLKPLLKFFPYLGVGFFLTLVSLSVGEAMEGGELIKSPGEEFLGESVREKIQGMDEGSVFDFEIIPSQDSGSSLRSFLGLNASDQTYDDFLKELTEDGPDSITVELLSEALNLNLYIWKKNRDFLSSSLEILASHLASYKGTSNCHDVHLLYQEIKGSLYVYDYLKLSVSEEKDNKKTFPFWCGGYGQKIDMVYYYNSALHPK